MRDNNILQCSSYYTGVHYCTLTPACKGWGCRLLGTPINEIPVTEKEKAKLFSTVYREAKQKGVLECPHYRSLFIDEVLESISKMKQIADNNSPDFSVLLSDGISE